MSESTPPTWQAALKRGASAALIAQIFGALLTYGVQILLAQWMGASDYGTYEYAIAWGDFLAFLAGIGLPQAVLRFTSEYAALQDWSHLKGLMQSSWWQTLGLSVGFAGIATGVLVFIGAQSPLPHQTALLLGMWSIPLQALVKLQIEMVRGWHRIGLAYVPSLVIWPLFLLVGTGLWRYLHGSLNSLEAIALSMLALFISILIQLGLFHRRLPTAFQHTLPTYAIPQWLQVAMPMLLGNAAMLVLNQTDTLMIGTLMTTRDVGIYAAALKTASWVNFLLFSVNAIAAPLFGELFTKGDRQSLQHLVSTVSHWIFWPALLITMGLIGFGDSLLHLFGAEFTAARWAMAALALGQLVNVGAGSVGYLLAMTGHQNQSAFVFACSAVVNVLLNSIGIPLFGILGAAIATGFSMALWNIWLYRLVVKYLGIRPSIIAAIKQWYCSESH